MSTTTRKKRMPKDLRDAVEAYLRLGPKSYCIFFELFCSAGEDVPWCLDRRGYVVPQSIVEIGKPIELSERERAEAEWARRQEHLDRLREKRTAKRMRREQRAQQMLAEAVPQGSA